MRILMLAAALAGAPLAAAAQDRSALFIAPMGEPFRAQSPGAALQAWFAAADADGDGRLDLAEFVGQAGPFHTQLDRNSDGRVTAMESTALFQARAPEMFAAPPPQQRGGARVPPDPGRLIRPREERPPPEEPQLRGAARFGLLGEIEPVMSCDADLSRWVDADEYRACAERRFRQLDADGDGTFTLSESARAAAILGLAAAEGE